MKEIDARTMTPGLRKKILEKYDRVCVYCYEDADQVDHIIPWSYKRCDDEDNLVACCWICNLVASSRVFDTFQDKQDFVQKRRYKWIQKHPIPLWTREEVDELGVLLKADIERNAVILDTNKERNSVKAKLLAEGLMVMAGKKL